MTITFLKKASKNPATETANAQVVVNDMLAQIEARGEAAVKEYAEKLDKWTGPIEVTEADIERRIKDIPASIKADIEFATAQVRQFALACASHCLALISTALSASAHHSLKSDPAR